MLGGLLVFCAGSVVAAPAPRIGLLVAGRAVMGVGTALHLSWERSLSSGTIALATCRIRKISGRRPPSGNRTTYRGSTSARAGCAI
jgi:MFS family permease